MYMLGYELAEVSDHLRVHIIYAPKTQDYPI